MTKFLSGILLFIICILLSGCAANNNSIYVSVKDDDYSYFKKKADEYMGSIKIKTDNDNPDIIVFNNISDYLSEKEICSDLSEVDTRKLDILTLKDGDTVLAVPKDITYYYLVCHGDQIDMPRNITDFSDLKAYEKDRYFFAPLFDDEDYINALLSIPIYEEFSQNDDYKSPILATYNAKRLVFFYEDKMKEFAEFYKERSSAPCKKENVISDFLSQKYTVMMISSSDRDKLSGENISVTATPVLAHAKSYIALNKSSKNKDKIIAFLSFIEKNSAPVNEGGSDKIIPVLTSAFPDGFKKNAPKIVNSLLSNKTDFEDASEKLKELWKESRDISQAQ